MESSENQGSPNEAILSQEQFQRLMTYFTQEMQRVQQQNVNDMKGIMNKTLEKFFSSNNEEFENINAQLQQLKSGQISQNETQEASNEVFTIIGNEEAQKRIVERVDQKLVDKFQNLPPVKKAFARSGLIGAAGAAVPIAAAGIAIAVPVALVALPLVLLYIGLKRATPSKAEFKQSWQEMKKDLVHDIKNLASKGPGETNLEKLWKSAHKPGVTAENPNLEEFLTKYCFPDQNPGEKIKVKFDLDKIEALKAVVKTVDLGLDQNIDRVVKKGNSVLGSDYVKASQDGVDTQFIQTINDVVTKVMAKDHRIEDKFKGELAEIKKAKAAEEAANKENSFFSKIKNKFNRSSSHTENVGMNRRESSSSQDRGV